MNDLIHTRGEDGLLETFGEHVGRNLPHRSISHGGQLRELVALVTREFIAAFAGDQFDCQSVVVDRNRNRHIREVLHDFQQQTGWNRHFTRTINHVRSDAHRHGHIQVGGCDFQLVLVQMEQEVVQDGQSVLGADDTAKGLQAL